MNILFALSMMIAINSSLCQYDPPHRLEGVEIGTRGSGSRLDLFVDAHCPDSSDFYILLNSVLDTEYNNKPLRQQLSVNLHIFVLPFHFNSFLAAIVLDFMKFRHIEHFIDFLEIQFASYSKYDFESMELSQYAIQDLLIQDAKRALASNSTTDVDTVFEEASYDYSARTTYRYGCSRGVYDTPTLFVNDVMLPDLNFTKESLFTFLMAYI